MTLPSKAVVKDSNTNELREHLVFPNGFVSGDGSGLTGVTSSGVSPTSGNSIVQAINNAATTESINNVDHANTSDSSTNSTNAANLDSLSGIPIGTSTNGQVIKNVSGVVEWGNVTSSGTVTSITADSPLTGGTITTAGNIGIQTASAIQSGAISSTDWSTFNNKITSLTASAPLTGGTLTNGSTVGIQNATTAQDGALTSTDWNTFNGKLSPTGNGSGLTNLNASNISSGSLADARLSANVPLLNAANTFNIYQTISDNTGTYQLYLKDPTDGASSLGFYVNNTERWTISARGSSENNRLILYTPYGGGLNPFSISTNGYIGLGNNTSPSEALDVTGNIKTSGQFKGSGAGLTANTVPASALAYSSGTASSSTYYRGDGVWATPSGGGGTIDNGIQNFRLTLSSGVPVASSDVTAATTLYLAPYTGNRIALYYSSAWAIYTTSQVSVSIPSTTATNYDVWAYYSGSAVALECTAWTDATTRASALAYQDGVLMKSCDATRRYIGTIRTTSTSGQCEDSVAKRLVWNYYNRVSRQMFRKDPGSDWTYSTNTFRQANNNTANKLEIVQGVAEESFNAQITVYVLNSTSTPRSVAFGLGLDSTTDTYNYANLWTTAFNSYVISTTGSYTFPALIGYHSIVWLEYGNGTDTQTWNSGNCYIHGIIKG